MTLQGILSELVVDEPVEEPHDYCSPDDAFSKELRSYLLLHPTKGVRIVKFSECVTVIGVFTLKGRRPTPRELARCIEQDKTSDHVLDVHILHL